MILSESTAERYVAACAIGAMAGALLEKTVWPALDGPLAGALLGACLFSVALFFEKRRHRRNGTTPPTAPPSEPFVRAVSRPGLAATIAYMGAELARRSMFPKETTTTRSLVIASGVFLVVLAIEFVYWRGKERDSFRPSKTDYPKEHMFRQIMTGATEATGLGATAGTLLKRGLPTEATTDVYGIAVGFVLYGVWITYFLRKSDL